MIRQYLGAAAAFAVVVCALLAELVSPSGPECPHCGEGMAFDTYECAHCGRVRS